MTWNKRLMWIGLGVLLWNTAQAQVTERISVSSSGVGGDRASLNPAISADGRFVSFTSQSSNLVQTDTFFYWEVYVHDRQTGTTELISIDANGVPGQGGESTLSSISGDGRFVAFQSEAINLVPSDTNNRYDIFVRDRQAGTIERVSVSSSGGEADDGSFSPSISADGRYVAFLSYAGNLTSGGHSGQGDIYVHDRVTGTTEQMSVDSSGTGGNGHSADPSISADGQVVSFWSMSSNLVPGDTNDRIDTFVHDRSTGITERVSVDSNGIEGDAESRIASVSADGRFVAFWSAAHLAPGSVGWDVFLRDRVLGTTTRVAVDSSGTPDTGGGDTPSISPDGRYVAFVSRSGALVPGDSNFNPDVFVHDRYDGTTHRISVRSNGAEVYWGGWQPSISADGQSVAFSSYAPDLAGGDGNTNNGDYDVFVHVSAPPTGTPFCFGDGSGAPCPCGNSGNFPRGCQNSTFTGGALLAATGVASLGNDTLQMTAYGERASALSVFYQGDVAIAPTISGDGLRCVGGNLKRLYSRNASVGVVTAPVAGDTSISARSAALGDPIPTGATRYYHVYYRDPTSTYCADPPGNTWNVSSALSIVWDP